MIFGGTERWYSLGAAIYLRVSTADQVQYGNGIEAQRERTRAMAVVKDLPIVGEYIDDGYSGIVEASKRPGLSTLLTDAHNKVFDTLIVLALDRLARNTRLILSLFEELTDCGCNVISCKESIDTTTAQGQFMLTVFAAMAELERNIIFERTRAGAEIRAQKDGDRGGRLPFGYTRSEAGGVMVNPLQASIVKAVFALRDKDISYKHIAVMLNNSQINTANGGKWQKSSVKYILQQEPIYRGGQRGESAYKWPAILGD